MKEVFVSVVSFGNEEATGYVIAYAGADREEAIYQAQTLARSYASTYGSVEADLEYWVWGEKASHKAITF